MGERKVLNKYYPPDFDPAKIPRRKKGKNEQMKVRMMLPMSIRCNTCGNYIYKGTKFNSRKEDVENGTYLGIQIFRFYFKCTRCSAELIMNTDPQNMDYTMEAGATRNFEPWREKDEALDAAKKQKEMEEEGDAMKALENRTVDAKREMDILAALDEMRSMRSRQAGISTDDMLTALKKTSAEKEEELAEEDERVLRMVFAKKTQEMFVRLDDEDEEDEDYDLPHKGDRFSQPTASASSQHRTGSVGGPSASSRSQSSAVDDIPLLRGMAAEEMQTPSSDVINEQRDAAGGGAQAESQAGGTASQGTKQHTVGSDDKVVPAPSANKKPIPLPSFAVKFKAPPTVSVRPKGGGAQGRPSLQSQGAALAASMPAKSSILQQQDAAVARGALASIIGLYGDDDDADDDDDE